MDRTLRTSIGNLICTKENYERHFNKRVLELNGSIHTGDYVYLDSTDGSLEPRPTEPDTATANKLRIPAMGPFNRLSKDLRTFVNDLDGTTAWVSAHPMAIAPPNPHRVLSSATRADFVAKIRTSSTYTVDKTLEDRADRHGLPGLFAKWSTYRAPTWDLQSHILEELVSRYFGHLQKTISRHLS